MIKISSQSVFSYSFRHGWLVLYVALNVVATFLMIDSGELIGDAKDGEFNKNTILLAGFLVVGAYTILLWPVFNILYKFKVKSIIPIRLHEVVGDRIGVLVLMAQILFLISNSLYGINIAGAGNIKSGNAFTYIFIIFDPDFLFFIYYGVYRRSKFFVVNLVIFIISNLIRGWNGIFLFILFFETCRLYRNGLLTTRKIILIFIISIFLYPVASTLKWVVRASAFSDTRIINIIPEVVNQLGTAEAGILLVGGVEHMISRLQSVSLLADVMQRSSQFQTDFYSDKFLPFWLEGLHGLIYDRLLLGNIFTGGERPTVGVIYAEYIAGFSIADGVGNAAISYPGWFFIAPHLSLYYIFYTVSLGWFSIFLVKKISPSESAKEMVWLAWLLYLLAPWFGAMFKFIYTALFFLAFQIVLTKPPRFKLRFN